ncbi:MAG: hypothetical protein NXI04_15670 [Planctomycetaceae bacterium]|nr:hypothetical protein [Planctomycetaceae bacterium]
MSADDVPLHDVQALVFSAFPACKVAQFHMLTIVDQSAFRQWMNEVLPQVTSAAVPAADELSSACQLAFSSSGLSQLGVDTADGQLPPIFVRGTHCSNQQSRVGDIGENAPEHWHWGSARQSAVDAVLLTYGKDVPTLTGFQKSLRLGTSSGFSVAHSIRSCRLADDREHFGFRDGINQPRLQPFSAIHPRSPNHVAVGEFLFGHRNQDGDLALTPLLSRSARDSCSTVNGSFLVFRQLEQDVPLFWSWLESVAGQTGLSARQLAEKMLGLSMDGISAADTRQQPRADGGFRYAHDRDGRLVPIGSHVRRANPRDSLFGASGRGLWTRIKDAFSGARQSSNSFVNRHRIIRRGFPYGSVTKVGYPESIAAQMLPCALDWASDERRGLNFLCLNADLSKQFELIQNSWLNSPKFGDLENGVDPIAGVPADDDYANFRIPQAPTRTQLRGLPQFIRVRGSAYLMLPSLQTLRWLAQGPQHGGA